jgi:RIO kinase 2
MKLDAGSLRYMSPDDFRVLAAVEAGMRNHDLVPTELISSSAGVRGGGAHKILGNLLRLKLVYHESRQYDGYRLTYGGYDFLALRSLLRMGAVSGVGMQIGVGKESDIFLATNEDGEQLVLKLQRLGRTSFRAIKKVRPGGQGGGRGEAMSPAG